MVAKVLKNVAETYTGPAGAQKLTQQGYDPDTIAAMRGAGTQVLKFRGGMPLLGVTRILGQYRIANSMALLDAKIRGVGPDQAIGARGWDNYSWHTDLPPGHTMVTGNQSLDYELHGVENAKMVIIWGMNWITTKMPDAHWLTEARVKGTKVVVIACEYTATCNKADHAIVVPPGMTAALALGLAQVIMHERLYDDDFVKQFTDLPLLVRMDNLQLLKASEVFPNYRNAPLRNQTTVMPAGDDRAAADAAERAVHPAGAARRVGRLRDVGRDAPRAGGGQPRSSGRLLRRRAREPAARGRGARAARERHDRPLSTRVRPDEAVPRRQLHARANRRDDLGASRDAVRASRARDRAQPRSRPCSRWAWGPTSSSTTT